MEHPACGCVKGHILGRCWELKMGPGSGQFGESFTPGAPRPATAHTLAAATATRGAYAAAYTNG